jgi:hypothetical protein
MKRKLLIVALCALFVVLFAQSTGLLAQESTLEPTPVVVVDPPVDPPVANDTTPQLFNTALIVIGAIVTVAFGVFGYLVRPAIIGAVAGMPQWGAEMLLSAGDAGLDALENYTETTITELDDTEVAKLRREFELLREEVAKSRQVPQG